MIQHKAKRKQDYYYFFVLLTKNYAKYGTEKSVFSHKFSIIGGPFVLVLHVQEHLLIKKTLVQTIYSRIITNNLFRCNTTYREQVLPRLARLPLAGD